MAGEKTAQENEKVVARIWPKKPKIIAVKPSKNGQNGLKYYECSSLKLPKWPKNNKNVGRPKMAKKAENNRVAAFSLLSAFVASFRLWRFHSFRLSLSFSRGCSFILSGHFGPSFWQLGSYHPRPFFFLHFLTLRVIILGRFGHFREASLFLLFGRFGSFARLLLLFFLCSFGHFGAAVFSLFSPVFDSFGQLTTPIFTSSASTVRSTQTWSMAITADCWLLRTLVHFTGGLFAVCRSPLRRRRVGHPRVRSHRSARFAGGSPLQAAPKFVAILGRPTFSFFSVVLAISGWYPKRTHQFKSAFSHIGNQADRTAIGS